MPSPDTKIQQIVLSAKKGTPTSDVFLSTNTNPYLGHKMMEKENQEPSFYVVRDDLLHPLVNGNKSRKLDALIPLVEDHLVTDVVSFQSF